MLGFLFHKKRDEVQRVLHGRVNRAQARSISANNFRNATRGTFTEVVWVIPCPSASRAEYARVFPALTKDISTHGLSLFHTAPITEQCVIVGLKDEMGRRFLACTPKHCVAMDHGFYQIGLRAEEVVSVGEKEYEAMCTVIAGYGDCGEAEKTVQAFANC